MLAEIETRLQEQASDTFRLIDGAVSFAALKGAPPRERLPAVYVIPIADDAGRNTVVTAVRQVASSTVGLVYAIGNLRDPRGQAAAQQLETLFDAGRGALVGWKPAEGYGAFTFQRGRAVAFRDSVVWWQDEFKAEFVISG